MIVGFNDDAAAAELIQQGDSLLKTTIAQQPYMMGYQVVEYAVKAINSEEVPEVVNAPVQVITTENVDKYLG